MYSPDGEDNSPLLLRNPVEENRTDCHVRDWVGSLVSIASILSGIICITVISLYKETVKDEYGIVLDAGSTHTNMFIYKWRVSDIIKGTALVKQIGQCTVTDEGFVVTCSNDGHQLNREIPVRINATDGHRRGISSYDNPEDAGKSLHSCIERKAKKLIPSYAQNKSPIYLGATAGMRLLKYSCSGIVAKEYTLSNSKTNFQAASEILTSVRKALANSPFMFEDNYARIITGKEEGISSWITVNYLKDALDYSLEGGQNAYPRDTTFGALDMGGASTQITFVPTKPAQKPEKLTLYGKEYQVFTHSFLCYGMTEAQRRFFAQLVKEAEQTSTLIHNPCGPKGYDQIVTSKYLWAAPCVQEKDNKTMNFTLRGTGDLLRCAKEVSKLFNSTPCHDNKSCSFDAVYLPPTDGVPFLAFSGFYGVINDLNLTSNASLNQLEAATKNICNKSLEQISDIHSANPGLLSMYCFDAQYIFTMLSRGYHFNTTKANLRFIKSINHLSIGWALGFMINATNLLPLLPPSSVPINEIQSSIYLAVVIVGALLISAGVLVCMLSAGRIYKRGPLNVPGLVL